MVERSAKVGPPADRIVESEVDGNISLFDPDTGEVSMLNDTASDLWRLADGSQTIEEMIELAARAYGVEPSSIADEVRATVETFEKKGFLSSKDQA
jgi:hypothetical protein